MYWWLTTIKEEVDKYWGIGAIGLLFFGSVLYFYVKKEKSRELKSYIWYVLFLMLLIINPIFLRFIESADYTEVYERFFWLFLSPIFICVAGADIASKKRGIWIWLLILLVLCGRTVYVSTEYKPAENRFKIRQEAIEVSEIILRDYEGLPEDAKVEPNRLHFKGPRAMVAEPICEDIRMYNANIQLLFVRRDFGNYDINKKTAENLLMDTGHVNLKRIIRRMKRKGFTYVVFGTQHILPDNIEKYPIRVIGRTENYIVYKLEEEVSDTYTITQFADGEGLQCMSYLIEDKRGGLIAIDGGRAWQTLSMVEEIKKRGGKVDYWIITHPHDDHCGVISSLLEAAWQKSELYIGEILIGEMDFEAVKRQGIRVDAYSYLLKGLSTHNNVTWLKEGDKRNLLGLKMEVFHTCDNLVINESDNILNDGSMVFKLSAKEESILYLADIGKVVADEIIEQYGDRLNADYVQMSHHGNGSLPDAFYTLISPRAALFDAPDWLMENKKKDTGETAEYTTPHYINLMKSMGSEIISYKTAPNEITLH